jgi:hypothetical protein
MTEHTHSPLTISSLAPFSWLQGAWRGEMDGVTIEEQWSGPLGDSLMGMFRYVEAGRVRFFELMSIEIASGDEQAIFRIKHFNPALKGWEEKDEAVEYVLVSLADGEAVFVRQGTVDRKWMVYRRRDDSLRVTFQKGAGETPEGEFVFTRVHESAV